MEKRNTPAAVEKYVKVRLQPPGFRTEGSARHGLIEIFN